MKRKHRIVRSNGMRLAWTNTSRIPDADIVAALKFMAGLGVDIDKTVFHFKRHGLRAGRLGTAYRNIPWEANLNGLRRYEWRNLVTVSDHYHAIIVNGKASASAPIRMDADIFDTLAHECKHVEDFRLHRDKPRVQWERKARAFAEWATDRWLAARAIPLASSSGLC